MTKQHSEFFLIPIRQMAEDGDAVLGTALNKFPQPKFLQPLRN
jgi:hypothetical protein